MLAKSGITSVLGTEDRKFNSSFPGSKRRIILRKFFIILVMCISIFSITSTSFADRWMAGWSAGRNKPLIENAGNTSEIMGKHIIIRDVQVVNEHIVNGKAVYMYKLIIQRPSNDNGTGVAPWVAPWGVANTRLYYWAGKWDNQNYFSLDDDREVVQVPFERNDKLIVVWVPQGMTPSRNKQYIRVGALPYPMAFGYDFRRALQKEENVREYFGYLKLLFQVTNFPLLVASYVGGQIKNYTVDSLLSKWITIYGQVIEIEVRTKIPNITGATIQQADKLLRERYLMPLMVGKVYTPDRHRWGKVRRLIGHYDVIDRNRILPQTQIRYEAWTSTPPGNQNPQPITPGPIIKPIKNGELPTGQKSFVAYYKIHGKGFAADFSVQTEANFNKFKSKTSKKMVVLGRGRTQKEAELEACSKLTKLKKSHIGRWYRHNGWLLRGVGGRCK